MFCSEKYMYNKNSVNFDPFKTCKKMLIDITHLNLMKDLPMT